MTIQELLEKFEATIRDEIKMKMVSDWVTATTLCYTFCHLVSIFNLLNPSENHQEFLDKIYLLKNNICKEMGLPL